MFPDARRTHARERSGAGAAAADRSGLGSGEICGLRWSHIDLDVDVEDLQPSVEQLADSRTGTWASLFVDLAKQPGTHLLGLITRPRLRRHDLAEVSRRFEIGSTPA